MGTRFARFTRFAAASISALILLAAAACGSQTPSEQPSNEADNTAQQPTGPITVVSSLNQWGSLAAELGGDDVKVTSIVNSTNVDAHDFEPKTSDVAKLSKAQIVVANGAGYDSWATKSLSTSSNLVSAASVVGAMEGDNPHLWFSKDARSGMAEAITEAYIKALPSKKKDFQQRLKTWQQGEKSLEKWTSDFTKKHSKLTYAATEPVVYYLMADLGFDDSTPKGYSQSIASGGEVAPADLQSFQEIIEDRDIDVLINNTQESSDATNMITGTAGRSDVPVVDVSEQMPKDATSLNAWINQLVNAIIDAVDPTYGCDTDDADSNADANDTDADDADADSADNTDGTSGDGNTTGNNGNGTDGATGNGTSNDGQSSQSDESSDGSTAEDEAPNFIRECKASSKSTSTDANGQTSSDGSDNTDDGSTPSNAGQTDPGK
ncbi:metal ABC transporter solute-binding protein [Bifidobacterium felsineum]|uniref:ABC transporter substrate-binding protein n=1 Tax=Bifidobacterium felsineum TaxID=2045440 RepID=A0A2M9HKX9_9BIFI|nr:metal ABC transporter solute-binding protein [Bifidobacterium felsineum]MBT1164700.1 metal ABC transporter solute-binding protein [Bifidobacterium felsineum]PJM77469.1 ABC transporter substrate-binding protein [Bifidobacterium felsineum]